MKFFISFFTSVLLSQTLYQGSLDFSYSGSETGSFSSSIEDTTSFGGALNLTLNDSSSFLMMGIAPRDENIFDLFLTILQDSIYPIQPRSWDISIADIADLIEDPLSFSTLSVFVPGLDSSFANQWLTFFSDTSNINDSLSLNVLTEFFIENMLSQAYIAASGNINISGVNNQVVWGNFSLFLIKPGFPFPSFLDIENGVFDFIPTDIENLSNHKENNNNPYSIYIPKAYPNPFNPQIKIPFSLAEGQYLKISIVDLNGKVIKVLSDQYFHPGNHYLVLSDQKITSGIYFINIYHKNGLNTQKITYLK